MRTFSPTSVAVAGLLCLTMAIGFAARAAADQKITPVEARGFPCERIAGGNDPSLAIDGDLTTFTWTTLSFTTDVAHLGLDFGQLVPVYRIRLWKERDGGGGQDVKDLVVEYTTADATKPLSRRRGWVAVTNLATGLDGETLVVDAGGGVNPDGTVSRDIHDSPTGDGWASLTFDAVMATAVRIEFDNPDVITFNHYKVYELEAYSP